MNSSAKIIADSVTESGDRLTTFEVVMHRFVLAEFNTIRVFSRNSASSRAIPVRKQLERVATAPAYPLEWPGERPGMQGGDLLPGASVEAAKGVWRDAADDAVLLAEQLMDIGVHKSVVNRILEPYMWHTVIVSATCYQNFFALRANSMAQPEIRVVAELMKKEYFNSKPEELDEDSWHVPYLSDEELRSLEVGEAKKVSAARCARVSYLTHDGVRDISKDLDLYDRLESAGHMSPFEHVATPDLNNFHLVDVPSKYALRLNLPKYGNFRGWRQMRFDVEAEKGYQAYS